MLCCLLAISEHRPGQLHFSARPRSPILSFHDLVAFAESEHVALPGARMPITQALRWRHQASTAEGRPGRGRRDAVAAPPPAMPTPHAPPRHFSHSDYPPPILISMMISFWPGYNVIRLILFI